MAEQFKISPQMTKKQLIEEHERLLEAYRGKVSEVESVEKESRQAVERLAALEAANEATVDGVIENLGQLRSQMGRTLNELTERMTAQAEKLDTLNRAVGDREQRLAELSDLEVAGQSLSGLLQLYDERRETAGAEFDSQLADLEARFRSRAEELQADIDAKRTALHQEMAEKRSAWLAEREAAEKELAEARAIRERERQREEEEYAYTRDRERRREEDEYQDAQKLRERESEARAAERSRRAGRRRRRVAAPAE